MLKRRLGRSLFGLLSLAIGVLLADVALAPTTNKALQEPGAEPGQQPALSSPTERAPREGEAAKPSSGNYQQPRNDHKKNELPEPEEAEMYASASVAEFEEQFQ